MKTEAEQSGARFLWSKKSPASSIIIYYINFSLQNAPSTNIVHIFISKLFFLYKNWYLPNIPRNKNFNLNELTNFLT